MKLEKFSRKNLKEIRIIFIVDTRFNSKHVNYLIIYIQKIFLNSIESSVDFFFQINTCILPTMKFSGYKIKSVSSFTVRRPLVTQCH